MELRGFRGNVRPVQLQAQRSHEDQVRHAILCREPHWFRRVGWEVHQLNLLHVPHPQYRAVRAVSLSRCRKKDGHDREKESGPREGAVESENNVKWRKNRKNYIDTDQIEKAKGRERER